MEHWWKKSLKSSTENRNEDKLKVKFFNDIVYFFSLSVYLTKQLPLRLRNIPFVIPAE